MSDIGKIIIETVKKVNEAAEFWIESMLIVHGGIDYIGLEPEDKAKKAVKEGFVWIAGHSSTDKGPVYTWTMYRNDEKLGEISIPVRVGL